MGAKENKVPDRAWLLNVLAIFAPNHPFFQKDYVPPPKVVKKEDLVVDNRDNFFSGLPKLHKKKDLNAKSRLSCY